MKVKAWATRGPLMHSIECTSLLTQCVLNQSMSEESQLAYSMAIVRFVNGLLDPLQQTAHAIPLRTLAQRIELPDLFVEIRHAATHQAIPPLEMLQLAGFMALNWLWTHFWDPMDTTKGQNSKKKMLEDQINKFLDGNNPKTDEVAETMWDIAKPDHKLLISTFIANERIIPKNRGIIKEELEIIYEILQNLNSKDARIWNTFWTLLARDLGSHGSVFYQSSKLETKVFRSKNIVHVISETMREQQQLVTKPGVKHILKACLLAPNKYTLEVIRSICHLNPQFAYLIETSKSNSLENLWTAQKSCPQKRVRDDERKTIDFKSMDNDLEQLEKRVEMQLKDQEQSVYKDHNYIPEPIGNLIF